MANELTPPPSGTRFSGTDVEFLRSGAWYKIGYRNVPPSAKTAPYTLQPSDVGTYVRIGTGGSVTIPNSTFADGDIVSIVNNTSAASTITCAIAAAYVSGVDIARASVSLPARGVVTVLFMSGTACILSGPVS